MKKWITCIIMAVMMAAMIFMGTGNNVFANDEVTYDSNMQTMSRLGKTEVIQ